MTKDGKLIEGIFEGETINTPSMLCVEDYLDALKWAETIGGLKGLIDASECQSRRAGPMGREAQLGRISSPGPEDALEHVGVSEDRRSVVHGASEGRTGRCGKKIAGLLEKEGVALDIGGYRDAPPGLRIWCGATVERADIETLTPWLDWAFAQVKQS